VRDTQRVRDFASLAAAFADLTANLNQPQLHNRVLEEAGVSLDAALARVLLKIERNGAVGLVDLADQMGRDHTTVSRQVTKLVELGLVERRESEQDRRVSKAAVTTKGGRIARAVAAAHARIVLPAFDAWSDCDFTEITRLMRRLADDVAALREPAEPA
jgi:DNA-binding MarR family transcriptional regulator